VECSAEKTEELFQQLELREISNAADLRAWILDWSKLSSSLAEESARRYVAMTCDTTNKQAAEAYEFFVSNIDPIISEKNEKLQKKLIQHKNLGDLENEFGNWFKAVRTIWNCSGKKTFPLKRS